MNTFKKEDYNSKDGMLTTIWGPSLWHSLHAISFNYPIKPTKEDKQHYLEFFKNLRWVLPCKYCRENYVKNIKQIPLTMKTMQNRATFSRWLYDLHEEINKMLGKKSNLSFDDVRNRYEMFRSRCIDENKGKSKKQTKKYYKKKKNNNVVKGKSNKNPTNKEKGCTTPYYGNKSRCVINIVPKTKKCKSFNIDRKCIIKRAKK
jgi:hypothetical protein